MPVLGNWSWWSYLHCCNSGSVLGIQQPLNGAVVAQGEVRKGYLRPLHFSHSSQTIYLAPFDFFQKMCVIMFSIVVVQRYSCLSNTTVDSLIEHAVKITLKQSACQQSKNSQKSIIIIYCEIVIHFLGTRFEYLPVVQWITTASIQAVPWFALTALYMWLVER